MNTLNMNEIKLVSGATKSSGTPPAPSSASSMISRARINRSKLEMDLWVNAPYA